MEELADFLCVVAAVLLYKCADRIAFPLKIINQSATHLRFYPLNPLPRVILLVVAQDYVHRFQPIRIFGVEVPVIRLRKSLIVYS